MVFGALQFFHGASPRSALRIRLRHERIICHCINILVAIHRIDRRETLVWIDSGKQQNPSCTNGFTVLMRKACLQQISGQCRDDASPALKRRTHGSLVGSSCPSRHNGHVGIEALANDTPDCLRRLVRNVPRPDKRHAAASQKLIAPRVIQNGRGLALQIQFHSCRIETVSAPDRTHSVLRPPIQGHRQRETPIQQGFQPTCRCRFLQPCVLHWHRANRLGKPTLMQQIGRSLVKRNQRLYDGVVLRQSQRTSRPIVLAQGTAEQQRRLRVLGNAKIHVRHFTLLLKNRPARTAPRTPLRPLAASPPQLLKSILNPPCRPQAGTPLPAAYRQPRTPR